MIRRARRQACALAIVLPVAFGAVACTSSGGTETSSAPAPATSRFCDRRTRGEISTSVGVPVTRVSARHRDAHRYSCRYEFASGSIGISVTGYRDEAAAHQEVRAIGERSGRRPEPPMLGEELEALVTRDGTTVVRHDHAVLVVGAGDLPATFGQPPQAPAVIALAVTVTLLGHWVPG
jgi:hypothetical protein